MIEYPDRPPNLSAEDMRDAKEIWCVAGINFQFFFLDRKVAEHYAQTANGFYHLGDLCKAMRCKRKKSHATPSVSN